MEAPAQNNQIDDSSRESGYKYGVAWSDNFKIDCEVVDGQHKRLFEMVSELVGSCMDGSDVVKIRDTLNFLADYTVQHFDEEEELQLKYGYPDYENHKRLHEEFKAAVMKLIQQYIEHSSSAALSNDVNKFIVRWLVKHIMGEDKKIGRHIRQSLEPKPAS